MEPWLQPALRRRGDAGGRPLGDRGAGGSLAGADGGGRARRWPRRSPGWRRRGRCGSSAARGTTAATGWSPPGSWPGWASRSRRCCSGRRGAERRRAPTWSASSEPCGDLRAAGGSARSSTRSSAPGSRGRRGSRPPRRSRRSTAAARRSSPATSPPGSTPPAARSRASAVEADVTVSFHAAKLGHRIAPGKWHTGELRVAPIGIPDGRPGEPAGGTIDAAVLGLAPRRGPRSTKFSSGQVDDRRRLARPDRRGADVLAGGDPGRRRLRDGRRPGRPRAGLRAGPARGDVGRLPGRRRLPGAGLGEGGAARLRARRRRRARARAWAGTPASVELAREVAGAIEAPLVIDADGLNAFAGRLERIAARGGADGPHPARRRAGPAARASTPRRSPPTASPAAREAASAAGAVVVLKGDDTIVTDGERVAVNALSAPGPRHRRHRRRPLRDRRGAARPRPGALRRRLRGGPRPRPRRPRRRRADRRRRVGDRHRRDRLDPGGDACVPGVAQPVE